MIGLGLGWVALLGAAAWGFGAWLPCPVRDAGSLERGLLSLALGRWVLMAVAGLLGAGGVLGAPVLLAFMGLGLALAAAAIAQRGRPRLSTWIVELGLGRLGLALLGALLPSLTLAVAPAVGQDALQYQLALPARWLAHGGFVAFPHWYGAWFPGQLSLLLLWPMLLPREAAEVAAGGFVWALALETALWLPLLGRRLGLGVAARLVALGTLLGATTWLRLAGLVSSDVAVGWAVSVYLALLLGGAPGVVAGLGLGIAGATKYTAAFFAAPLWFQGRRRLVSAAVAACVLAPWLLRAQAQGGHPLAPFYSPVVADQGEIGPGYGPGKAPVQLLWASGAVFAVGDEVDGRRFAARFPALPLLAAPLLLGVAGPRRSVVLACAGGLLLWASVHQRGAYLLAGWPLLALCVGIGADRLFAWFQTERHVVGVVAACLAAGTAAWGLGPVLRDAPSWLPPVLGLQTRSAWRAHQAPEVLAVQRANAEVQPGERIAIVWGHGAWWAEADTVLTGADHQPYCRAILGPAEGLGPRFEGFLRRWNVGAVVLGPAPLQRSRHAVDDATWQERYVAPAAAVHRWAETASVPVFRFEAAERWDWQGIER